MVYKEQKSWHITVNTRHLVISVSRNELKQNYRLFKSPTEMAAVQKHTLPSFPSIISALSVVFYCVGFIRVELEMNKQKNRINALENVAEAKPKSNDADMEIKNAPGKSVLPPRSLRSPNSFHGFTITKFSGVTIMLL